MLIFIHFLSIFHPFLWLFIHFLIHFGSILNNSGLFIFDWFSQGNIRVFVRVRPINSKEKPHEPEGEPTINFKDDVNIGGAQVICTIYSLYMYVYYI